MGKFAYALTTIFFIEMALWLFGGAEYSSTSLFNLVTNPSSILTNPLYIIILAGVAVFAATQIIPGNLYQINVYGIYAGFAAAVLTFATVIAHLSTFIYGELSGVSEAFALPITAIITAPLLIFYIVAVFEWIRSN